MKRERNEETIQLIALNLAPSLLLNFSLLTLFFLDRSTYQRLSEIEKQAIAQLSNETGSVFLTQFMAKCQGSQLELFKAIQSLDRRGTIAKLNCESETVFTIPPVLKQYVKMVAE